MECRNLQVRVGRQRGVHGQPSQRSFLYFSRLEVESVERVVQAKEVILAAAGIDIHLGGTTGNTATVTFTGDAETTATDLAVDGVTTGERR